jgi:8-oxo-dGTP pyrophosphatase MutT (NUDIX family)
MFDQSLTLVAIQTALLGAENLPETSDFDLNHAFRPTQNQPLRDAAVMVPLMETPNGPRLLLTKRSARMKHHPGQIAFPGGKVDATDATHIAAAIREANEEIGLPYGDAQILGDLPKHETVTGFSVQPVLAKIPADFVAIPETGEVQHVFSVPLGHVLNPDNFIVHERVWNGQKRYYYAVPYGPYYIWGATARILRRLAEVVETYHAD